MSSTSVDLVKEWAYYINSQRRLDPWYANEILYWLDLNDPTMAKKVRATLERKHKLKVPIHPRLR